MLYEITVLLAISPILHIPSAGPYIPTTVLSTTLTNFCTLLAAWNTPPTPSPPLLLAPLILSVARFLITKEPADEGVGLCTSTLEGIQPFWRIAGDAVSAIRKKDVQAGAGQVQLEKGVEVKFEEEDFLAFLEPVVAGAEEGFLGGVAEWEGGWAVEEAVAQAAGEVGGVVGAGGVEGWTEEMEFQAQGMAFLEEMELGI